MTTPYDEYSAQREEASKSFNMSKYLDDMSTTKTRRKRRENATFKRRLEHKAKARSVGASESVTVEGKTYTLEDMRDWFIQIRSFHEILYFGKGKNRVSGEGQSGGRAVSDIAHAVENAFVEKLGESEYTRRLDKLMKGHEHETGGGYIQ